MKHSSFKDSGKKRNSATPVSPKNRGLANSRSATAQNLYQLSNIKGSVIQKNLNLYEQAKYASLKSSKSGKLSKPLEHPNESSKNTFLNRGFQQDSSGRSNN